MTAEKPPVARSRARQRTIYCLAEERAALGARAEATGMNFSRFMVACALHGEDEQDDRKDGPRLVLREREQRELLERVNLLDRCNQALLSRLPWTEMSALGALAFLVHAAKARTRDGGEEPR